MIIQAVADIKFYDLSNEKIVSEVNSMFTSYISGTYPFRMSLLGVKIIYPKGSFPENNTIGINLLQASSMETQFKAN